ncbi:hypothetical protein [Streptomyces sp. NPDC059979]
MDDTDGTEGPGSLTPGVVEAVERDEDGVPVKPAGLGRTDLS